MKKIIIFVLIGLMNFSCKPVKKSYLESFASDTFRTSFGELKIYFIGHASLVMQIQGKIIHIDPYSQMADYKKMPSADLILLTHEHRDHLDLAALSPIRKEDTKIILSQSCTDKVKGTVLQNGEKTTMLDILIEAVPAYNLVHKRENGEFFHPKGRGNGYVLNFGDKRVYIGGDTENILEMKQLNNIAIAFLPMNVPFTMTPAMTADAGIMIKPKILYPYHYRGTDPELLRPLLHKEKGIEVRIRKM